MGKIHGLSFIRGQFRQVPRVHCNPPGHWNQPGANHGHSFDPFPEERQGGPKANWNDGSLSRFISRLSDKSHAFFGTLKKPKDFQWTEEYDSALHELKAYLTTPPLLSKPLLGEVLLLYLAVSEHAVSAVLVREEGSKQLPICHVSKVISLKLP